MRYSSSMLAAIVICFFVFLGMSLLVTSPKYKKSNQIEMVSFSKVVDMDEPTVKPDKPIEPPKQEAIKQPPAAPAIDLPNSAPDRNSIDMPVGIAKIEDALISKIALPDIKNPGLERDRNSPLSTTLFIEPIYPAKAIREKIEGWVKVEFVVNEFGKVTEANVIDAKPKRIFNNASLKTIRKYKFKPRMVDGKPVAQRAVQIIEFKIAK